MEMLHITPKRPIGLAFEISDLLLLQCWAKFHDVRMVVELDHWVEGEEYEEVVAFYAKDSSLRRWILWRSASDIVVQLLIGRTCRFASVAEALDSLPATRPVCQEGGATWNQEGATAASFDKSFRDVTPGQVFRRIRRRECFGCQRIALGSIDTEVLHDTDHCLSV